MKRRMFAWFLVMVLALGLISTTALAARKNVCTQIRGNAAAKQTFRVVTGSRWLFKDQITLTQEKGSYLFRGWTGRDKTVAMYGKYDGTYKKVGGRARTVKWTGRNCTLRLDQNSVYTVTIRPLTMRRCRSGAFSMDMACAGRERPAGGSNRQKGSSSAADAAEQAEFLCRALAVPGIFAPFTAQKQLYFCAPYATVVGKELCWGAPLPGLVWEI